MKIGILDIDHHKKEWNALITKGIILSGNEPVLIKKDISNIKSLIVVGMSYNNYNNASSIYECLNNNIPVILIDSGIHYAFWSICINKSKRNGISYTDNLQYSDSRRKKFLSVFQFKEWNEKIDESRPVSLLLHNYNGYANETKEIRDKKINEAIKILEGYGHKVNLLEHPKIRNLALPNIQSIPDLINTISISKFCVSWHSNSLCHSAIMGVPTVALSDDSFARDVSSNNLNELIYPDRNFWINRMSWCHWDKIEMGNGTAFRTVLENI